MKKYEVVQCFEASDKFFRASFDFGFNTILRIYCDCNSLAVFSNFSRGACQVSDSVIKDCYQTAINRFFSFVQSGRKTEDTCLTIDFDSYGMC